jgi:hypothetical protein
MNPPTTDFRRAIRVRLAASAAAAAVLASVTPAASLIGPAQAAPPAASATDFTWAIQPSGPQGPTGRNYFVYDLKPGSEVTDHVRINNLGTTALTFDVYGTDAFTTTDGAFALLPASQTPTDVGSWITLAERRYQVPAGGHLDIPFRLAVPANATPGDHAGGVISAVTEVRTDADGQRVNVDRRIAARVYLRVTGDLNPSVTVDTLKVAYDNPVNPLDGGAATVVYQVRNTGNVRISGTGEVAVTGPFGWRLARTDPAELPELLPGAAITVTERITGLPPALRLTARVTLATRTADTALPEVTRSAAVWAPPWVLLALLIALGGWGGYRWWRRRAPVAKSLRSASNRTEPASTSAEPAR